MLKKVANTLRIITITPNGSWIPGSPNYTQTESDTCRASNNKIVTNQISWTQLPTNSPPCSLPGLTFIQGGSGASISSESIISKLRLSINSDNSISDEEKRSKLEKLEEISSDPDKIKSLIATPISISSPIKATSIKCKCDGNYVVRENDYGVCSGQFNSNTPPYNPISCSCRFEVTNAGQTKLRSS